MATPTERFVPKIHPATRAVEPDDPMVLYATPVAGDPEEMIRAVVQEYAWMGWNAEGILRLFQDPFYPALHALLENYGEARIRKRIDAAMHVVMPVCIRESIVEEEASTPEPELIELGVPTHWAAASSKSNGE